MRNSGRSSRLTPEGLTAWRHRTSGSTARLDEMTNSPSPYLRRGWLASRALSAPHVAPGSEIRMIDHVLNRLKRFRLRIGARGLEQHPTTREIDLYGVGRAPPDVGSAAERTLSGPEPRRWAPGKAERPNAITIPRPNWTRRFRIYCGALSGGIPGSPGLGGASVLRSRVHEGSTAFGLAPGLQSPRRRLGEMGILATLPETTRAGLRPNRGRRSLHGNEDYR